MPSLRGIAPTKNAASISVNAVFSSAVGIISIKRQCLYTNAKVNFSIKAAIDQTCRIFSPLSKGKAQSLSSITTPSKTPIIGAISKRWRDKG